MKIYVPVHLIILLLRLRNKKKDKLTLIFRFVKGFLRSSLFTTFFALSIPAAYCFIFDVVPYGDTSNYGLLIGFIASCAIFFDDSSRWGEISLYVLAKWFEGIFYSLLKRKYISPVPHWEVGIL